MVYILFAISPRRDSNLGLSPLNALDRSATMPASNSLLINHNFQNIIFGKFGWSSKFQPWCLTVLGKVKKSEGGTSVKVSWPITWLNSLPFKMWNSFNIKQDQLRTFTRLLKAVLGYYEILTNVNVLKLLCIFISFLLLSTSICVLMLCCVLSIIHANPLIQVILVLG